MPAPVSVEHTLALLARVRAAQAAAGALSPRNVYDVRAFKSAFAELGYLRRLAAVGSTGGTVVTSMPQLVAGLARLHPAWRIDDDAFADRDRHHSAVRRRLRNLQAMGLLDWRIGIDIDGEDARTELVLRDAPDVSDRELAEARARLTRWRKRYGPALNTGSSTGIRNAAKHGRPLSDREREQRGRARALQRARRRGEHPSPTETAPRFAAPPTSEDPYSTTNPVDDDHACGLRTRVTRTGASNHAHDSAARNPANNNAMTIGGEREAAPIVWDSEALLARVAQRQREREPVLALITRQAVMRSDEVRGWGLERAWPASRLREAWVVARYGSREAAEWGPGAAGTLEADHRARLRRAVARYERNTQARPPGFPAGGLAALLHLGELGAADAAGPRTLRYAIGALDQLSRRMRAVHSDTSPERLERAVRLASQRHRPDEPRTPLDYRRDGPRWPRWVTLDVDGHPVIRDGELQVDGDWAPRRGSDAYRSVARDAHLLDHGRLPAELDGRATMSDHTATRDPATDTRHARPGPYPRPEPSPSTRAELDIRELAQHTGLGLEQARRVSPLVRDELLAHIRTQHATRTRDRQAALLEQRRDREQHPEP